MKRVFGLLIVAAMAAPASAQIVVDGTKDAGYGAALAVQTVETRFGDAIPTAAASWTPATA